jgi:hypothetical protein
VDDPANQSQGFISSYQAVFRYAAVACTVHRRVGLDGADRSAAPTTLESQDDVRGSQRVSAVEREGASEVGSLEPSPPDRLSEQYLLPPHKVDTG